MSADMDKQGRWYEGLRPRWVSFVEAYCTNGGNATKAAVAAGYSERTARSQGSRLLTNVDIRAAIELWHEEHVMSAAELKAMISDDARASLLNFVSVRDGQLVVDWQKAYDANSLHWLREFSIKPGEFGDTVTFKLVNDQKAKDQLIRILGLGREQVDMNVTASADVAEIASLLGLRGWSDDSEDD